MMSISSSIVPTRPPLGCAAVMMEVLRGELRERELPFTQQREAIARVLFESTQHLSADEVEAELLDRDHQIGKATVYRTLALLVELGLATEHDFDEGFRRYQMTVGAAQYDHLICTVCGNVTQFREEALESVLGDIVHGAGFAPITRQIKIFGTCRDCT
ncbi:MAG: Fur family transcriptional regulator [Gemmatimonadota bacterium]